MNIKRIFLFLSLLYFLNGCSGDKDAGPWSNYKPLNEIDKYIQGYYNASLGEAANPKSGNPAVYVDFSDGLSKAYTSNPDNNTIVKAICDKLSSPTIEWYAMESSKNIRLQENSSQVYNKVTKPQSYTKTMAPIEEALKQITRSNNDALLITDFEEYKQNANGKYEEETRSYSQNYFTEWIKNGNSITFFYTNPYTETSKNNKTQKHLYFTVFTHGKATETSFVSMIRDALKGRFNPKVFELNNNPYSISNDYGGKENTGIANHTFAKWVNYNFNASSEKNCPMK